MHPKTGGMGRINDIVIRYVAKLSGKYDTTSEAITKSTIIAIIILIFRSFQRKWLCDSSLKAKSNTFECC